MSFVIVQAVAGLSSFLLSFLYVLLLYSAGYFYGKYSKEFSTRESESSTLDDDDASSASTISITEEIYKCAWLQITPSKSSSLSAASSSKCSVSNSLRGTTSSKCSVVSSSSTPLFRPMRSSITTSTNNFNSAISGNSSMINSPSCAVNPLILKKETKRKEISSETTRYFVVLKNQNLFIYTNEQQVECLAALCLEDCQVNLENYDGSIRNDELFSPAFPIKIWSEYGTLFGPYAAFNLYFESGIVKEDWFYALRKAIHLSSPLIMKQMDCWNSMTKKYFEHLKKRPSGLATEHSESLNVLNLLIGRIFFNIFDSGHIEKEIVSRFKRKLELSPLPSFLSDFSLTSVKIFTHPPLINHVQLNRFSDMGDLSLFAGIVLDSEVSLVIQGKVLSEHVPIVGKFKAFEIPIAVKVTLKRIEGKALISIRKAPSDRMWFGFMEKPKIDLSIEPVVASRAINISIILDFIQAQAIEAINSSLIYPCMEDVLVLPPYESCSYPIVWQCLNPYSDRNVSHDAMSFNDEFPIRSRVPSKELIKSKSSMYIPPLPPNISETSSNGGSPSECEMLKDHESAPSKVYSHGSNVNSNASINSDERYQRREGRDFSNEIIVKPPIALLKRNRSSTAPNH